MLPSLHGESPVDSYFHAPFDAPLPAETPLWNDTPPGPASSETIETTEERGKTYHDRFITNVSRPTLTLHRPPQPTQGRTAIVVCPGGGYSGVCIDKEGHDVARWLNSLGITAAVLKYRCGEFAQYDAPRLDVQQAIRTVRGRSRELGLDEDQIGVLGFSAGGHLASTAATHFQRDAITTVNDRPDFAILAYPVISMDSTITHAGSRDRLLGPSPTADRVAEYSNELRVSDDTPPVFLVHTLADPSVVLENSLRFYRALQAHRVPVEFALYEQGAHGFGLGVWGGPVSQWPQRCAKWLGSRQLLAEPKP